MDVLDGANRFVESFGAAQNFDLKLGLLAELVDFAEKRGRALKGAPRPRDATVRETTVIPPDMPGVDLPQRPLQRPQMRFGNEDFEFSCGRIYA